MTPRIDVHLAPGALRAALRADVAEGLTSVPKELPPKWFYDDVGSQLFDEITRLPEYYPTRRERWILEHHAADVARLSGADTLVELGSGTSEKTRLLLDAFVAHRGDPDGDTDGDTHGDTGGKGGFRRFVPFDVSETTLRDAAAAVAAEYPTVLVHAVVGDFEHHLGTLPAGGRRLVAFLGGTIGNFDPKQRAQFLADLAAGLAPGDGLLLGTDLVKDLDRLVAAYDDTAGVTAAFNRNVLAVVNRELDADFVPGRFAHVARFDTDNEWIEMLLRAEVSHEVRVGVLDLAIGFEAGELMRTEISAKFRREGVEAELASAGLGLARWWTDPDGDFAVSLSFKE